MQLKQLQKFIIPLICVGATMFGGCRTKANEEMIDLHFEKEFTPTENSSLRFDNVSATLDSGLKTKLPLGKEQTATTLDGSKVVTTTDGYGNKVEVRTFSGHSRLVSLMSATGPDGQREVYVYGQTGAAKKLPKNMIDRALTASADEIAAAADLPVFDETNRTSYFARAKNPTGNAVNSPPLSPVPSYKFLPPQTAVNDSENTAPTTNDIPAAEDRSPDNNMKSPDQLRMMLPKENHFN